MKKEEIERKLTAILAGLGHGEASFSLPFAMNKIDSLDVVELMMSCETEFNIIIHDKEMADCKSLEDLVLLINSKT